MSKTTFAITTSVALVAVAAITTVESSAVDASADVKVTPNQVDAIAKALDGAENEKVKNTVDAIYNAFSADVDLRGLSSVKTKEGVNVATMWFLPDERCHHSACHCYFECYTDDACTGLCYTDGYTDFSADDC
jgi:predicted nucleotidyltransferase